MHHCIPFTPTGYPLTPTTFFLLLLLQILKIPRLAQCDQGQTTQYTANSPEDNIPHNRLCQSQCHKANRGAGNRAKRPLDQEFTKMSQRPGNTCHQKVLKMRLFQAQGNHRRQFETDQPPVDDEKEKQYPAQLPGLPQHLR